MGYEEERWRPVPGFPAYEVSDHGRVRNIARGPGRVPGRILRPTPTRYGHLQVDLSMNSQHRPWSIHRLVLMAFVGPCPDGMECCHNDSDPTNNALSNLRWDTRLSNVRDMVELGTARFGGRTHAPKARTK